MRHALAFAFCFIAVALAAFAIPVYGFLGRGDGTAEGKKSIGGSGQMKRFATEPSTEVVGIRIHGSRYGEVEAPDEQFLIYFLSEDRSKILHTEMADYSIFHGGVEAWVEVFFEEQFEIPESFWVALDFRAQRSRGVYVSYDEQTGGQFSRIGLPGLEGRPVDFGGDWMIEVRVYDGTEL